MALELFKLLGTVAIETDEAKRSLDETVEKAEQSESRMSSAFKKIGSVVAAAFAVDKIVDFGAACIDAAADANAIASQFSQVFGDYEGTASGNLQGLADEAGIAVNRMKSSYTKIAAFAKTTGMETADALALADRALVAVADSAAFYDRTLEETTESLQSFLKGNFENDAALGLSCTETTRNAKANELYGQSFKDLSESQKQLTLLAMVEDANKLSGAIGQAARESDTWTNQTGNLAQKWKDFKAVVGKNFLGPAIRGVKMLSGAIDKLTDAVNWLTDNKETVEEWVGVIVGATTAVGTFLLIMKWDAVMSAATTAIQGVATGIHKLNTAIASNPIGALCSLIAGLVSYMVWLYQTNEDFRLKVNAVFADIWANMQPFVEWFKATMIPMFQNLWQAIQDGIAAVVPAVQAAFDWIVANGIPILQSVWQAVQDGIAFILPLLQTAFETISSAVVSVVNFIKPLVQKAFNWFETTGIPILQKVWQAVQDGIAFILPLLQTAFETISSAVVSVVNFIKPLVQKAFNWFETTGIPILQKVWKAIQDGVAFILPILETAFAKISAAVEAVISFVKPIIQNVVDWFDETFEKSSKTTGSILEKIKGFFSEAWNFVKDVWEACKPFFDAVWENILAPVGEMLSEMFGAFKEAWNIIVMVWEAAVPYFKETWEGIKTIFSVVIAVLGGFFREAWETIKAVWDVVEPYFAILWEAIKGIFSVVGAVLGGYFKVAWETIKAVWDVAISFFTAVWAGIRAVFAVVGAVLGGDFEHAWEMVKNAWNQAGDFFSSVWNAIKNIFKSVDEWFEGIFDAAFSAVVKTIKAYIDKITKDFSDFIDRIKNFFNFEVSLPNIALPHFSISPSGWQIGDLLEGSIPTLGIDWYAKGGVMEEPTVFGMNGNKLMAGGEAGPEAIAPIAVLQDYIAQAVAAQNAGLVMVLERILNAIIAMDENMGDNLREALEGTALEVNHREFGRLVKAVN